MIKTELDHCRVVMEVMADKRTVNEEALASIDVLKERLDRLQQMGRQYASICFSPMAQRLSAHAGVMAVR